MVLHTGDLVDDADTAEQWTNADAAVDKLDVANIPYLLALGNHDLPNEGNSGRTATAYNANFGQARYTGQDWWNGGFYAEGQAENAYNLMTIDGNLYLFLSLEFGPRDAVLTWADGIIAANPTATVIIVTHSYLYQDGTRVGVGDAWNPKTYTLGEGGINDGEDMWTKLVKKYANIALVVSGHHVGPPYYAKRTDSGDEGNIVNQMFFNHQNDIGGGNGWMRVLTIDPTLNTVRVQTFSP